MADIFISYSSRDRSRARQIAVALEAVGWSVWWDQIIPPGRAYDVVIEEQVSSARCVIVLWSGASVESAWVRAEAGDALNRGILIPTLVEEVTIPLVFRQIHAAGLIGWDGDTGHHGYHQMVSAVAGILGPPPSPPEDFGTVLPAGAAGAPAEATGRAGRPAGRVSRRVLIAGGATVAVLAATTGIYFARPEAAPGDTAWARLPDLSGTWTSQHGRTEIQQSGATIRAVNHYPNGNRGDMRGELRPDDDAGDVWILEIIWWNGADHGGGELRVDADNPRLLRGYFADLNDNRGDWILTRVEVQENAQP